MSLINNRDPQYLRCLFQLSYPVQSEHKDYPPLSDFSNEYLEVLQQVQVTFLTAACCPKRVFYTHTHSPPPKKWQQTFVLHTQKNNSSSVLRTQKKPAKKQAQKVGKKVARKVGKKFIPEPVLLLS